MANLFNSETENEIFDLKFGVNTIRVQHLELPGQTFFKVNFSNETPSLTLLKQPMPTVTNSGLPFQKVNLL